MHRKRRVTLEFRTPRIKGVWQVYFFPIFLRICKT